MKKHEGESALLWFGLGAGVVVSLWLLKQYAPALWAMPAILKDPKIQEKTSELIEDLSVSTKNLRKAVERSVPIKKLEKSVRKGIVTAKKLSKKTNTLVQKKLDNALTLLTKMEKGKYYTQRELVALANVPYRSIRRYVDALLKEGSVVAQGYGKGKRFLKK